MNFVAAGAGAVYDPKGSPLNYKFGTKELQETGFYDFGARMLMPDVGRWFSVDPLAEKSTRYSPYVYAFNNPLRFIDPDGREGVNFTVEGDAAKDLFISLRDAQDERNRNNAQRPPDDITVNSKGIVTNVKKTNKPNRFFDENGKQLFFNDPKGVDKDFSTSTFKKKDRLYYPISRSQVNNAVNNVGLNKEIIRTRAIAALLSPTNELRAAAYGAANAMIAYESYNDADFTFSFLDDQVESGTLTENGLFRAHYVEDDAFFKFEGSNTIYNIYDAGNFMWGNWTKRIGLSNFEIFTGSQANELRKGSFDAGADQNAITNGRKY